MCGAPRWTAHVSSKRVVQSEGFAEADASIAGTTYSLAVLFSIGADASS